MSKAKKAAPTFDPSATREAREVRQKRGRENRKQAEKQPTPEPTADLALSDPPFECHYDKNKGCYYTQDESGEWIKQNLEDVRRELRAYNVSGKKDDTSLMSPQDRAIRAIQKKHSVDYAGPLAGHFAGFVMMNKKRLLVTDSPNLPEPCPREFPTLTKFLNELFGDGMDSNAATQRTAFDLWAARGWRAIDQNRKPTRLGQKTLKGHALIMAGPAGCGKNLLQENVITPLLGGRAVKAGDYLLGRTEFSGSVFAGESVILTDEQGNRDARSRRDFGERIKNMVANDVREMHHKGRESMSVTPCQRLSISVNDEPEHLQTLPSVSDGDIAGKVHLLMCYPAEIPSSDEDFEEWLAELMSEIPGWLHHCLSLEVPPELIDERPRFGAKHFHHPALLERLNSFTPWMHLMGLIGQFKEAFFGKCPFEGEGEDRPRWEGSASKVRSTLQEAARDMPAAQREINELLRNEETCGRLLTKLSKMDATKSRVLALNRLGIGRRYVLYPPPEMEETPAQDDGAEAVSRALQ